MRFQSCCLLVLLSMAISVGSSLAVAGEGDETDEVEQGQKSRRSFASFAAPWLSAGLPEGLGLGMTFRPAQMFALQALISGPLPIAITAPIPTLASRQGAVNVGIKSFNLDAEISYGPQIAGDFQFFPWGERFYVFAGLAYRQVNVIGKESTDAFLCLGNRTDCGVSLPVDLRGQMRVDAVIARLGIGWQWAFGQKGFLQLHALGIAQPLSTSYDLDLEGEFSGKTGIAGIDSLLDQIADGILNTYEPSWREEIKAAVRPYAESPLPIITLAVGFRL